MSKKYSYDPVNQGQWKLPDTLVSSTTKTDCYYVIKILLKDVFKDPQPSSAFLKYSDYLNDESCVEQNNLIKDIQCPHQINVDNVY